MIGYRPVAARDLALICRHRHEMFKASGRSDEMLAPMAGPFVHWLKPRLASGAYFGWIAERAGEPVGGLGMMVLDWPPHPLHLTDDRRDYLLNLFVEPEHRGQGIAGGLMDLAMAEARARGLSYLILHATQMARPMYEAMGWGPTSELAISVGPREG